MNPTVVAARKKLLEMELNALPIKAADEVVAPVLETLASSITRSARSWDDYINGLDEELIELGVHEEIAQETRALQEELLGAAFVVLQRTITDFATRAVRASHSVKRLHSGKLVYADWGTVRKDGFAIKGDSGNEYPYAFVVSSVANYYKHRDEPSFWNGQDAAPVVRDFGLDVTKDDNLETAVKRLGAAPGDLVVLLDRLAEWSKGPTNKVYAAAGRAQIP